jgi:hypothetical protein
VISEADAEFLSFGTLIQQRNSATELAPVSQHAEKLPRDQATKVLLRTFWFAAKRW